MNWTLEVVKIPVKDADRAISFYRDKVGFNLDHDVRVSDEMRIVQLTPPGSGCSIVLDIGAEGVVQMVVVVPDIKAAHAELTGRGLEVSEITQLSPDDGGAFVFFSDPDGNNWGVQEIRARANA